MQANLPRAVLQEHDKPQLVKLGGIRVSRFLLGCNPLDGGPPRLRPLHVLLLQRRRPDQAVPSGLWRVRDVPSGRARRDVRAYELAKPAIHYKALAAGRNEPKAAFE